MRKETVHALMKIREAVLAYGMGPSKLASKLEISKKEAVILIDDYFKVFPNIRNFLDNLKSSAVRNGYAVTYPPFRRKRFFMGWEPSLINDPTQGELIGTIERAGANMPIQGSSADCTKLALVLVREAIFQYSLPVRLVMTVHDQIDTICSREYAERWRTQLRGLMEQAARTIITNGLLKAEVSITEKWSK